MAQFRVRCAISFGRVARRVPLWVAAKLLARCGLRGGWLGLFFWDGGGGAGGGGVYYEGDGFVYRGEDVDAAADLVALFDFEDGALGVAEVRRGRLPGRRLG